MEDVWAHRDSYSCWYPCVLLTGRWFPSPHKSMLVVELWILAKLPTRTWPIRRLTIANVHPSATAKGGGGIAITRAVITDAVVDIAGEKNRRHNLSVPVTGVTVCRRKLHNLTLRWAWAMVWCLSLMVVVDGVGSWTILWAAIGFRQWIGGAGADFWREKIFARQWGLWEWGRGKLESLS